MQEVEAQNEGLEDYFFLFNWVDFQVPAVKGVPLS